MGTQRPLSAYSRMIFPDEIDIEEMEIRSKEWELSGYRVDRTRYLVAVYERGWGKVMYFLHGQYGSPDCWVAQRSIQFSRNP